MTESTADEPLNALLLTPQLSRAAGGVWSYLTGLIGDGLPGNGVRATVAGVVDSGSKDWRSIRNAASVIAAPPTLVGARYGYSRSLGRRLREAGRFDLIHVQGLRTFAGRETLQLAAETAVPYLLTPHGMFHPQLRDARSIKKSLIDAMWDNRYIERAACLHATSELELSIIRDAGMRHPVAVVPIGVDLPASPPRAPRATKTALFLGILNRKKGLLRLLDAWQACGAAANGWSLVIAGPDDGGHRAEVERRVDELGLRASVEVREAAWGEAKRDLLQRAELFVLPTDWENFGIVVAEALAARLPVITTTGAPWRELQTHRCGWWIEPTVPALTEALHEACSMTDEDRRAMGDRGRALVETRYTWPAIGRQMAAVYRWVAGREKRPDCVHEA